MSIYRWLSFALLATCLSATAQSVPSQQASEQVKQLDEIVDLDVTQEREIRNLLDNSKAKTDQLRVEIDKHQRALNEEIGPAFDEGAIREHAEQLGEISGELTAETALLQARIQDTLTDEQRAVLVERMQRARQMQKQMQQMQKGYRQSPQ